MDDLINLENKDNVKLIKNVIIYPLEINREESGILVETLGKEWSIIYNSLQEKRISYSQAQINFPDGSLFNWDKVRQ